MSRARNWLRKNKRRAHKFGLCERCGKPFSSFKACYHVYSWPRNRERCHWRCIDPGEGAAVRESNSFHMSREEWQENKK